MNEMDQPSYMTTRELANTLGVDVKTIQRTAEKLFDMNVVKSVSSGGRPSWCFDEEQATAIKIELQNHSKVAKNGFNSLSISNDIEMMLLQKQLEAYRDWRIAELQEENDRQKQMLAMQAPKVDFYDCVTGSGDTIDMAEVAKVLNCGMGRNKIFELLRDKGVLNSKNQPYQQFVDMGYFRVIESSFTLPDGSVRINLKTVVFQKGLDFIRKLVAHKDGV